MRDSGAAAAASSTGQLTGVSSAEEQLARYKALRLPTTTRRNPLQFWHENAIEYPLMSETARRSYCISESSAQSERDFIGYANEVSEYTCRKLISIS